MALGSQERSGTGAFGGGSSRLDEFESFTVILNDWASFGLVAIEKVCVQFRERSVDFFG